MYIIIRFDWNSVLKIPRAHEKRIIHLIEAQGSKRNSRLFISLARLLLLLYKIHNAISESSSVYILIQALSVAPEA